MSRRRKWILAAAGTVVFGLIGVVFVWFVWRPTFDRPVLEKVDEYVWLDQGWGAGQNAELRQRYYYTPQGTSIPQGASDGALRYAWFLKLERPLSREPFASPENMRRYRFIVDPGPSAANPDRLPVGFTRHFDAHIGEYVLDITCAACHTAELHYTKDGHTRAIRIDGGPAMHAFTDTAPGNFAPELLATLLNTASSPLKFDRFARKVLGAGYPRGWFALHKALRSTVTSIGMAGQNLPWKNYYPVREGFGRTDALGRIGNTTFGDHLSDTNYRVGDAPVSYPYLWNTWKFDWVQYNGSVAQPLARNVGEALGVGAVSPWVNALHLPLPADQRFRSSVDIDGLVQIEHALHLLQPPRWPEQIFGPVDASRAARGAVLFRERCQECHGPHVAELTRQKANSPLKPYPEIEWRIEVIDLKHVGTDGNATKGFKSRTYDLSATGLTNADFQDALRPLQTRWLLRDARFRLAEIIRLRTAAGWPLGTLPAELAAYPDPEADRIPVVPAGRFASIDAALSALLPVQPELPGAQQKPRDPPGCSLDCHVVYLLWELRMGKAWIDWTLSTLDVTKLGEGPALNLVGILLKNRYYADHAIDYATQQCLEGFGALDLPQVIEGYKARPLEGVWATAPYLHNGSVPTLYQMLLPPDKRDRKFFVGRREYDPVQVGFVRTPEKEDDNGFWLDTTENGNSNAGHAFVADAVAWKKHRENPDANPLPDGVIGAELTDDERKDIVEYLKIHRDLPETPAGYQPPVCKLPGTRF